MRQLFPPRPGGVSGRRWLIFAVLCGLLAWLAAGELGGLGRPGAGQGRGTGQGGRRAQGRTAGTRRGR